MVNKINFKKNISISLVARILSMLIGFVVSIYVTRYLGPTLKGKMSYFLTLSTTIWMIMDLGFHKSLSYIIAKDRKKLNSLFSFSVLLHFIDIILLLIVVFYFKDFFYQKLEIFNPLFLGLLVIMTTITRFGFSIKFIMLGINRILWQNMLKFMPTVTYISLFFILKLFFKISDKYLFVLFSLIISSVLWTYGYTIKIFLTENINLNFKFTFKEIYLTYQLGIKAFLSSFFIFLLIRFDIFLIKKYSTLAELGIYSLAANFVTLLQSFSNLVGSLMLPKFAGESKNEDSNIVVLRRVALIFFFLMIMMAIIFLSVGKQIITIVYDIEFIRAFDIFRLLLPAVFFLSLGSLINTFFWSKGFPITTILLPVIALGLNIVLNIVLIPKIGINGAAIATTISYGVWLSLLLAYFFNTKLVEKPKIILWQKSDFQLFIIETKKILVRSKK